MNLKLWYNYFSTEHEFLVHRTLVRTQNMQIDSLVCKWETLENRRAISSLLICYKIYHGLVAIPLPAIITPRPKPRVGYPHQLTILFCSTEYYKNSFFRKATKTWNSLPSSIACQGSLLIQERPGITPLY